MDNLQLLKPADVKLHSRANILYTIYKSGKEGISQSGVARETGLPAPTIFRNFVTLEERGLIEPMEVELDEDVKLGKGRRPSLYRIKGDAIYLFGIEIVYKTLEIGVFNLMLEKVGEVEYDILGMEADEITALIAKAVEEFIVKLEIPRNKIGGVGISAPGIIDTKNGIILKCDAIKNMQDYPIADKLTEALNLKILLGNNVDAHAFYEHRYGGHEHKSSFTVLLRYGVNGAYVLNNKVHTDSNDITVDIEHFIVTPDGPDCTCGEKGCLLAHILNLEGKYDPDILLNLADYLTTDLKKLDLITDEIVKYLLVILRNINRWVSPDSFLILAKNDEIAKIIKNKIENAVSGRAYRYKDDHIKPFYSRAYNHDHGKKGMCELILAEYMNSPEMLIQVIGD